MKNSSQTLRNTFFWILDKLQGGPVHSHFSDIVDILTNAATEPVQARQRHYVNNILSHAVVTVPFYGPYRDAVALRDFPVVNKNTFRDMFDSFRSRVFHPLEVIPVVTSGSTGTPFKLYQDKNKKRRNHADTLVFAQRAGFELGHKLVYMKIWPSEKMRHPLHYRLQNILPVDVISLNDSQIGELVGAMELDGSTFGFLGYASALELVCKFLDKTRSGRVNATVQSVIAMSETLNDYTREGMRKYFGVPAVSRYSNLENGIIAQQDASSSGRYLINSASYVVEILKMDSDEPVEPGQLGRIVITDLFNYAMPMIRYDTGDVGALAVDPAHPATPHLATVEGRQMDLLYDTKGNLVSSFIVYKNMWKYTDIVQYQLVQQGRAAYAFKINSDGRFQKEEQLVREFKSYLGKDADFTIEYVSEIPLLASGKRKKIVNTWMAA